jgi:hypothetical protein
MTLHDKVAFWTGLPNAIRTYRGELRDEYGILPDTKWTRTAARITGLIRCRSWRDVADLVLEDVD